MKNTSDSDEILLESESNQKTETSLIPFDPLKRYLAEIRKYPPLSKREEHQLAEKYWQEGDLQAAYGLVTAHLMLVVKIAMNFRREYQNILDLIQEGNIGLMEAVKRFDPFRGTRLSTYANWWIKA